MTAPLTGLTVAPVGESCAVRVAAWFLRSMGARQVAASRTGHGDIVVSDGPRNTSASGAAVTGVAAGGSGVPPGTVDYGTGLALAGAATAAAAADTFLEVDAAIVAAQLFLPVVLAVARGDDDWPRPPAPRVVTGGALSCELGADDDSQAFERLLMTLGPGQYSADEVARRAQEWRLPVVPYSRRGGRREAARAPVVHGVGWRHAPKGPCPPRRQPSVGVERRTPPFDGINVVDLTAMWAGPLATWLLASLGATVWKVEPCCRQDGLRGDPDAFATLNRNKLRLNLDLRSAEASTQLEGRLARADVLMSSFSPRVLPNLGMDPKMLTRRHAELITVSMPAFPRGSPRRQWVAYGGGVHAASGLGYLGSDLFRSPAVTYPDPIAGLAAFAAVCAMILARLRGWTPRPAEVPLLSAVRPLLAWPPARWAQGTTRDLSHQFAGFGAGGLPPAPFRGAGVPVPDKEAP